MCKAEMSATGAGLCTGDDALSPFQTLLPELLAHIFRHLNVPNRGRAAQVCVNWRRASNHPSVWINAIVKLDATSSIDWENVRKRKIRHVKLLMRRTSWFLLCNGNVNNGSNILIDLFREIRILESLDLSKYEEVTDHRYFSAFELGMPNLTYLNLSGAGHIGDEVVQLISTNMKLLVSLDLSYCFRLSNTALEYIAAGLGKLKRLNLTDCFDVTDYGIERLNSGSNPPRLEFLALAECRLTNESMKHLRLGQQRLKHLDIGFSKIMFASLVQKMILDPDLRDQLSWNCRIGDAGLGMLTNGGKCCITSLCLNGCHLPTNLGLLHLTAIETLMDLNLSYCMGITGSGLSHLATIASLRKLNLSYCVSIEKQTLYLLFSGAIVGGRSKLTSLNISGCVNIEDGVLFTIAGSLNQLRRLTIDSRHAIDPRIPELQPYFWHLKELFFADDDLNRISILQQRPRTRHNSV